MPKLQYYSSRFTIFKPTGEVISISEIQKAHDDFFHGELTEEFACYCAKEAMHAFWINYRTSEKKIRKEEFCKKFKEIVNKMLDEI